MRIDLRDHVYPHGSAPAPSAGVGETQRAILRALQAKGELALDALRETLPGTKRRTYNHALRRRADVPRRALRRAEAPPVVSTSSDVPPRLARILIRLVVGALGLGATGLTLAGYCFVHNGASLDVAAAAVAAGAGLAASVRAALLV